MAQNSKKLVYNEIKELSFLDELLEWNKDKTVYYWIIVICSWLSIGLAFYHLFVAVYGTPEGRSFRSIHLSAMMVLAVFIYPLFRSSIKDPVILKDDKKGNLLRSIGFGYDLIILLLIIFVQLWTTWDIESFMMRYGDKYIGDIIVGSILIFVVLDATRRAVGWAMVGVAGFFMLHALYAHKFFGFFYGPPTRLAKYIDTQFMSSDGIFGIPLYVCSTYIVLFIIFGGILIRSGVGRFFVDLAVALTGHRTGGPAKAAVVASGMTGTVYGSAVANVVTTGSFTIPLMKNYGYRAKFAAAVEACASSGGQITPPIMGAAAFIMAEFLEAPYTYVILAALIPAFLYFTTIYFMVHIEAEKHGIEKIDKSMLPNVIEVLKGGGHMLLSLVVLVGLLIYGKTAMTAGFWSIVSVIILSFFKKNTRMSVVDLLGAFESGIKSTVPVTIACACAGIIIGSVFVSGLGLKFTQSVIDLSGGVLFILLCLTAISAIILGMGMTTTAVYITVAALIVPSLIEAGIMPIAAHMFAFYFGVVSTITPPVALASFAGAAIAKSPPMSTAVESSKVGIAKYIVPFAFVYNPSLLMQGPIVWSIYSFISVLLAYWCMTLGLEGWFNGKLNVYKRTLALIGSVALLIPPLENILGVQGLYYNFSGLIILAVIYFLQGRLSFNTKVVQ
ncbi:MAG: TRAP transporter permease [Proteobacteria bacterium]|nr:TRAP transporter permease [Pseudomonadota bacterium]